MIQVVLLTLLAALLVLYTFFPNTWRSLMARDIEAYPYSRYQHARYSTDPRLACVATRNPFRPSGPPVCMAKLIMQRHRIHQSVARTARTSKSKKSSPPPPSPSSPSLSSPSLRSPPSHRPRPQIRVRVPSMPSMPTIRVPPPPTAPRLPGISTSTPFPAPAPVAEKEKERPPPPPPAPVLVPPPVHEPPYSHPPPSLSSSTSRSPSYPPIPLSLPLSAPIPSLAPSYLNPSSHSHSRASLSPLPLPSPSPLPSSSHPTPPASDCTIPPNIQLIPTHALPTHVPHANANHPPELPEHHLELPEAAKDTPALPTPISINTHTHTHDAGHARRAPRSLAPGCGLPRSPPSPVDPTSPTSSGRSDCSGLSDRTDCSNFHCSGPFGRSHERKVPLHPYTDTYTYTSLSLTIPLSTLTPLTIPLSPPLTPLTMPLNANARVPQEMRMQMRITFTFPRADAPFVFGPSVLLRGAGTGSGLRRVDRKSDNMQSRRGRRGDIMTRKSRTRSRARGGVVGTQQLRH
ncbi:hypothetical protein AB1N83_013552 [Pleurotus pulmonarius]